jgi:hypothetical protein
LLRLPSTTPVQAPYFDRHKLKGRGLRLIIGGMVA